MYLLEPKTSDHTLEDVPNLRLEMIFVVMSPAKKSRHEPRQLRLYHVFWKGMNCQFNKAKSRLDNFAVCRGEKDKKCRENLAKHVRRNRVYQRERRQSTRLVIYALIDCTFELED